LAHQQPPLVVKICLWVVQVGLAVAIIGLWIATAVGIGEKVRRRWHRELLQKRSDDRAIVFFLT
jgi:hypothetical protein